MKKPSKKAVAIASAATLITVIGLLVGGFFTYRYVYDGQVLPNVSANGVELEGLSAADAQAKLQTAYEAMLEAGLTVTHDGNQKELQIQLSGSTDPDLVYDVVLFDAASTAQQAISYGNSGDLLTDIPQIVRTLFEPVDVSTKVTVLEEPIRDVVDTAFADIESPAVPTRFEIEGSGDDLEISVIEGAQGEEINHTTFFLKLVQDAQDLKLAPQGVTLVTTQPVVTESEASLLLPQLTRTLENAPATLTYTAPNERKYEWKITRAQLSEWLIAQRGTTDNDALVELALAGEEFEAFMDEIQETVNVAPQNARFRVEDGVAVEFAGSLNGVSLSKADTLTSLFDVLGEEEMTVALQTVIEEPEITTESVNDLGIKEVLGTGYSDFSGSPSNRIANIKHGVSKLDGLLIAPGETVSLIEKLKPFTISDGYLPELVIKGDEIKPEIGGGLCQIGSTTFRAVMNSGLRVDERRNHSLVVSYYNDPSNGNPGTDATLYDPAPDFKFTNDTENYILFEANVDMEDMELEFTFWGTSDGRKAYYTPPKVLSWGGYGATQYKETTSLAPGVTRCQSPHPGATTTFDYIVERPDGTIEKTPFNSTYRSLPKICLVGVAAEELDVGDVE